MSRKLANVDKTFKVGPMSVQHWANISVLHGTF